MLSWQEFTRLRTNNGLSVEQMRRNYMWYMWQYPWIPRGGPVDASSPQYVFYGQTPLNETNVNDFPGAQTLLNQTSEGPFDYFYTSFQSLQSKLPTAKIGSIAVTAEYISDQSSAYQTVWYVGSSTSDWSVNWPLSSKINNVIWNQIDGTPLDPVLVDENTFELSNWELTIPDFLAVYGNDYFCSFTNFGFTLRLPVGSNINDVDIPFWQNWIGNQATVNINYDGGTDVYAIQLLNVYDAISKISGVFLTSIAPQPVQQFDFIQI